MKLAAFPLSLVASVPSTSMLEPITPVMTDEAGVAGTPVIRVDSDGTYLAPGAPMAGVGEYAVSTAVFRRHILVDLTAGSRSRILVLSDTAMGVESEDADTVSAEDIPSDLQGVAAEVGYDGVDAWVAIYIRDHILTIDENPATFLQLANSPVTAHARGWLTLEYGPRLVRVWWDADLGGRMAWKRRAPDATAWHPGVDPQTWAFFTTSAVRRFAVSDVDPGNATENKVVIGEDVAQDFDDPHMPALAQYVARHQVKRSTASVRFAASINSYPLQADVYMDRIDPTQTILLLPAGTVDLVVGSLEDGMSERSAAAWVVGAVDDSGVGPAAGIGAGRTSLEVGGEFFLHMPLVKMEADIISEMSDMVTDTGGEDARDQASTRINRKWTLPYLVDRDSTRRIERFISTTGGGKCVWILPPLEARPTPVIISGASHTMRGSGSASLSLSATEAI